MEIYLTFSILVATIATLSLSMRSISILGVSQPYGSMHIHKKTAYVVLFILYFLSAPFVMCILFSTNLATIFCEELAKGLMD